MKFLLDILIGLMLFILMLFLIAGSLYEPAILGAFIVIVILWITGYVFRKMLT